MDTAVALVQAYLNVNGYFTVTEFPVLEAARGLPARSVTDLDILALRFTGAGPGHDVIHRRDRKAGNRDFEPDPTLDCPLDSPDMIVGEVKEGSARFNPATRDRAVLEIALTRFGCCRPEHAADLASQLLERGHAQSPAGHVVRMVAFGGAASDAGATKGWTTVPMRHVIEFLRGYLHDHWDVLRHAQIKDPTLAVLTLLEKWRQP